MEDDITQVTKYWQKVNLKTKQEDHGSNVFREKEREKEREKGTVDQKTVKNLLVQTYKRVKRRDRGV